MTVLKIKIALFVSVLLILQGVANAIHTTGWAAPLGAIVCITLVSTLIIVLAHTLITMQTTTSKLEYAYAFSSGALMAISFVHLVPEGLQAFITAGHGDGDEDEDTGETAWKGMSTLLAGFYASLIIEYSVSLIAGVPCVHAHTRSRSRSMDGKSVMDGSRHTPSVSIHAGIAHSPAPMLCSVVSSETNEAGIMQIGPSTVPLSDSEGQTEENNGNEGGVIENGGDVDVIENGGNVDESRSWLYSQRCSDGLPGIRKFRDFTQFSPNVWTITIGEGLHNAADGAVIAVAFLFCGNSTGWTVTLAVLAHEIPSEFSEYFVMIEGGCNCYQALFLNLLTSIPAFLACIIILASKDNITNQAVGYMLLISAGILIYISVVELLPRLLLGGNFFLRLFTVFIGCIIVSLPLINDTHCSVGEAQHP